jgi:large subunit ribosomal protein L25
MATQVQLAAEARTEKGKGPAGRLRKTGRVPGILYSNDIDSVPVHVDNLELYHALRTPAGMNVLIRLSVEGEEHLTIVREVQRHAVRGDLLHVDFQGVDRNQLIPAEIPVHLENEDDTSLEGGVVNLVLYTVPIHVKPLETPNAFTLDLAGLTIGDVLRVEDLADQLPEGAEFDLEPERTVVTINAPISEEALEALEGGPEEEAETEAELGEGEAAEPDAAAAEAATEDEGDGDE